MASDPGLEFVDVIDDEGRTVAVVQRRDMRGRRLPHRCTYILVFNARGDLFIHERTATKDVYPGYWDVCVGGVLAAGETFADGARRELAEELGVEAIPEELFPLRYADAHSFAHGMVYRVQHDGPFQLQPEEIVRGAFLPLDEVAARAARDLFCPDGLVVLEEYRRRSAAAAVVYTVAVTFQQASLAQEWLRWLRDGHLAEVLAGGATDAEIVEVDGADLAFEVRYHFPSRTVFNHYEREHAPRLRAEGLQRFPTEKGVTYRRAVAMVR